MTNLSVFEEITCLTNEIEMTLLKLNGIVDTKKYDKTFNEIITKYQNQIGNTSFNKGSLSLTAKKSLAIVST